MRSRGKNSFAKSPLHNNGINELSCNDSGIDEPNL